MKSAIIIFLLCLTIEVNASDHIYFEVNFSNLTFLSRPEITNLLSICTDISLQNVRRDSTGKAILETPPSFDMDGAMQATKLERFLQRKSIPFVKRRQAAMKTVVRDVGDRWRRDSRGGGN